MKLLFDQNLSFRLVAALSTEFPGSAHVRQLGLAAADDWEIWSYAATNPPKVIWIRLGNCSTDEIAAVLRSRRAEVESFDADPAAAYLALS